MTREEAIERLKTDIYKYADFTENSNENEFWMAFEMAIKALEQQTCTREDFIQYAKEHYGIDIEFKDSDKPDTFNELFGVEVCEDVVSRQAVEDAIANTIVNGEELGYAVAYDILSDLPSVNPQPKTGHWILLDECSNSGYYCSECHKKLVKEGWSGTVKKIKYCPNCGCRIVEPQESEVIE